MHNFSRKKYIGMILLLGFLYTNLVSIYEINGLNPTLSSLNSKSKEEKIDPRLWVKINDLSAQTENLDLLISFYENIVEIPDLSSDIEITKIYNSINTIQAIVPVKQIIPLSEYKEVESIWWNLPMQSDISKSQDLIKSAIANMDPNFANFTSEIDVRGLWDKGYNGSKVIIAVLDTGVDITGSAGGDIDDFDENTNTTDTKYLGGVSMMAAEPLYYSDLNGRGTFLTGVACGTGNINKSYIGVAPGANYLNVKIFDSVGITYWSFILSGIEWSMAHGADIMLFGTTIPGLYIDPVCRAINNAVDQGIFVVAPIGDDGPGYMSVLTPGAAHKAFTVGAYNSFTKEVWNESSRGPGFDFQTGPDVIAPGVGIIGIRSRIFSAEAFDMLSGAASIGNQFGYSFDTNIGVDMNSFTGVIPTSSYGEDVPNEGNYTRASTTGASAAIVAGAVAVLIGAFPLATPELIKQALMRTATSITADNDQNVEGCGLINVTAAFNWLNQILIANQYQIAQLPSPLIYPGVIMTADIKNVSQYSMMLNPEQMYDYTTTALFSTQGMMTALIITDANNTENMSIHLPFNQFGLEYSLANNPNKREFHWFSEFDVVREMHQMINNKFYQEGYNRYCGVLGYEGLYVVVIAEAWSYVGEYNTTTFEQDIFGYQIPLDYEMMNITNRVNAFKYTFTFINDRSDKVEIQNPTMYSYFKADLFVNETGLDSSSIGSALNFTYDDVIQYNESNQLVWVEDWDNNTNADVDKYIAMGFRSTNHQLSRIAVGESIGMLLNTTINRDNIAWNTTTGVTWNENTNVTGRADPGWLEAWNMTSIAYGQNMNFTGVLGVGKGTSTNGSRVAMSEQMDFIMNNVTRYNVTDTMVLTVQMKRGGEILAPYLTKTKVINIGNTVLNNSQCAFVVNRTNDENVIEIYTIVHLMTNFTPYSIREYSASWTPLKKGVYVVAWVIGDIQGIVSTGSLTQESITQMASGTNQEENILSNYLARTVFIIDGQEYERMKYTHFMVIPTKLDQAPMKIYAPLDFAIYNLTVLSIREIHNVKIGTDGLGKNVVFMNTTYYETLNPYEPILLILLANPICPPGNITFNVTFTIDGQNESFFKLPVEIQMFPNRGRIWFDAVHLNFFVSSNIVGTLGFSATSMLDEGTTGTDSLNLDFSGIDAFGNIDTSTIDFSSTDDIDISSIIDLGARLDTTWANYYDLRNLWAQADSNHGKGASLFTIIPFIAINTTEVLGIDLTDFRTSELIPATSFLGRTIGDYYFEENLLTTNYINHDLLQLFDAMVISQPRQAFLDREIQNITSWVNDGGTLYVFVEDEYHNNNPSLNKLLKNFNFEIANKTWFPYKDRGYYTYNLTNDYGINNVDEFNEIFANSNVSFLEFKNPIKISSLSQNSYVLCNGTMGYTTYGQGKVFVVGDADLFKSELINTYDNNKFAQQILRWGLSNYYQTNISVEPEIMKMYEQGFVDVNLTNADLINAKNLTSKGFLFVSIFFYENGTTFNASLYGMSLPLLPMFHPDDLHYATFFDSNWMLVPGDFYVLILIDHPAAASELFYIRFRVIQGPPPETIEMFVVRDPEYSRYIDIAAILAIVYMGFALWVYDMEKYKTRLRITQLKGDYLNIAKTKMNEGKSLVKLMLQGLEKGNVEEIERIRFLLSNRKKLTRYFKDLKDFGNSIGEHY